MNFIVDFFDFIVSTIRSFWDFFVGIVENLILLGKYIWHATSLAYQCIAQMPTWLQVFATLTISVSVLYLILGRTGGKSDE